MDDQSHHNRGIPDDGAFDDLLRSAKAAVPLPRAFQSEVWRRIAADHESTLMARLARIPAAILSGLNRPVAAAASVLLMVSGGLWLGSLEGHPESGGKLAYVESVSPFVQAHQRQGR